MNKNTQRGLGLLELLITLALIFTIVGITIPFLLDKRKDEEAEAYAENMRVMISRIHQYQYYKITEEGVNPAKPEAWPNELNNLMTDYPEQYWNNCSIAQEQNGVCIRPDFVPWSNSRLTSSIRYDYTTPAMNAHLVIKVPTSELAGDAKAYWRYVNPLMRIPGALRSGTDIEITLRQSTLALMYDNIVMRDGFTTLTGDWDVGGKHTITNTRDVTIANSDGTQKLVSQGLVDIYTVKHGDRVKKPSCPEGTKPHLALGLGNIYINKNYELTGSQKPFVQLAGTDDQYWQVGLEVRVKSLTTGELDISHAGEILAFTQCK